MRSAMIRAAVSVEPPGGKGTISVIGREGKGWAWAAVSAASVSAMHESKRNMNPPRKFFSTAAPRRYCRRRLS